MARHEESSRLFTGDGQKEQLFAELDRADLSRHLALFYEDQDVQLEVATIYLCYGLMSGKKCLYFPESNGPEAIRQSLRDAGIDVDQRIADGDLTITDATEAYLDPEFDSDRMISTLEAAAEESVEEGYDGLCAAGENTWCFHTDVPFEQILSFESEFDDACGDVPVTALCQYDLARFSRESAAKALWTHDQLIYQYTLCDNPYYIPPEEFTADTDVALDAKLMLNQTYDLARTQRQLKQREQRLEVVSRVLRHNIRNDLNVVTGNIELVSESAALSEEDQQRLADAIEHVSRVCEIAEKSRYVQQTLERTTINSFDLRALLRKVVAEVTDQYPDATLNVEGETDVQIATSNAFGEALVRLLSAIVQSEPEEPTAITISCEPVAPENVAISIEAERPLIPATDRDALERGTETQLKHGTGLDLWLAKWIIESGYGTVSFPEDSSRLQITTKRISE
ncbi:histidine kinase [Halovenus sp. WSH3]|uniref:histidine kinase n=1 Tax=Halovenus carboxidivorans TaxID=2692199 RepID=A0A6B0T9U6_9EURY|nr:MEDS domain-containing protein [Halovenus carboxidivorans]MXR52132.1 histidine kinase [Halovenus carboxidivorans]